MTPGGGRRRGYIELDDSSQTMSDVWNDQEAAEEMVSRLSSFDVLKLIILKMDVVKQKDDGSVTMKHYNMGESVLGDADNPEIPYDKEQLLRRYVSEDVIVLLNADINLINSVCADLGATPEDESILGNHNRLDAYGLARVNTFGLISTFSYIVQKMDEVTSDDVIVVENVPERRTASGDQAPEQGQSEQGQPTKPEVLPERLSRYELQIRRWVGFLQWMGNIAAEAFRDQATAAMFRRSSTT